VVSNKALAVVFVVVLVAVAGAVYTMRARAPAAPPAPPPVKPTGVVREYNVTLSVRGFWDKGQPATPPKIEANLGDTVRIIVKATDQEHAFVIDDYKIKRLIRMGQTIVVEFLADKPCNPCTIYDDMPGHQYQEQTQLWVWSPPRLK